MQLIIDGGSTKMEWILLDGKTVKNRFTTGGFNPNYADIECLEDLVSTMEICHGASLKAVHYYGTGCGSEKNCHSIYKVFQNRFPEAEIHVTHDLMAACHAVLGHEKGIVCILGTGSNSCVYDGENIIEKAVSLGYLVGDEGSGCHIGRALVRSYFYGFMPADLRRQFEETFHLEHKDFIDKVYHSPQPSRYLASFAKFAGENQAHPYVCNLVKDCFRAFIEAFVCRYSDCNIMKVSFIGSVAFHFQDLLRACLADFGLAMGMVMQTPSEGLIRYYQR